MPEHEPFQPEEEKELDQKEGKTVDEIDGFTAEELEQAHQDDATREAKKESDED